MGGTWPAGLLGPGAAGLAERSGPGRAHWRARRRACTDGLAQVFPASRGKIGCGRYAVAHLRRLRCSRTGRSDREAPVLSRPSTWPHRDSWTFERDRQSRIQGKIAGSRTGGVGGKERGRERRRRADSDGEPKVERRERPGSPRSDSRGSSRSEYSGAFDGFASRGTVTRSQPACPSKGVRDRSLGIGAQVNEIPAAPLPEVTCTSRGVPRHVTTQEDRTVWRCVCRGTERFREVKRFPPFRRAEARVMVCDV